MAKSSAPYILSLISGILIMLNGIASLIFYGMWGTLAGAMPSIPESGAAVAGLVGLTLAIVGIVAVVLGAMIIWGVTWLNNKKKRRNAYIMILIISIIGFFTGGGFIIGSILGIIGGALGLSE